MCGRNCWNWIVPITSQWTWFSECHRIWYTTDGGIHWSTHTHTEWLPQLILPVVHTSLQTEAHGYKNGMSLVQLNKSSLSGKLLQFYSSYPDMKETHSSDGDCWHDFPKLNHNYSPQANFNHKEVPQVSGTCVLHTSKEQCKLKRTNSDALLKQLIHIIIQCIGLYPS